MKTLIFLGAILLASGVFAPAYAQGLQTDIKVHRPDLSGKWKVNVAKSGFSGNERSDGLHPSWVVIITQNLPAIGITFRSQPGVADDANFVGGKFTLYSDGRGDESVPGSFAGHISYSEWKGGTLVQTMYWKSKKDDIFAIVEFELSRDRQTLNITSRHTEVVYDEKFRVKRVLDDRKTTYLILDRVID